MRGSKIEQCPRLSEEQAEETIQLFLRAHIGDHEAFNDLAHYWKRYMVWAANKILENIHDAEDAAQNAWVQLWKARPVLTGAPTPYLYACAIRAACDELRRLRRGCRWSDQPEAHARNVRQELHGLYQHRKGRSIVEETEHVPLEDTGFRTLGMLKRLVAQLRPEQRELIEARFFHGETTVEIAARTGRVRRKVTVAVDEAIRTLRRKAAAIVGVDKVKKFARGEELRGIEARKANPIAQKSATAMRMFPADRNKRLAKAA